MNREKRWLPRRRFSLRTLLILTAVVAVWLGMFVRRVVHMRAVVTMVADYGGDVFYDYQPPGVERSKIKRQNRSRAFRGLPPIVVDASPSGPQWLRDFLGDDYFRRISEVQLSKTRISDDDLLRLKSTRRLRVLSLAQTGITNEGLATLPRLPELRTLRLQGTSVTDEGLKFLGRQPALKEVDLRGTTVSREAVEAMETQLQIRILHSAR